MEASLPYEIRSQEASIVEVEPADSVQKEAMLRNQDIHHRKRKHTAVFLIWDLLLGYTTHGILMQHDTLFAKFWNDATVRED